MECTVASLCIVGRICVDKEQFQLRPYNSTLCCMGCIVRNTALMSPGLDKRGVEEILERLV